MVLSAKGEVSSKKKTVEPVAVDTLTMLLQTGDSLMEQYNTFEALKYYQQAFARCDSTLTRIKLAECYYKRANYHQTAELLKLVPEDSLSHEAFRQLAFSYQKQNDPQSLIYWGGRLVEHYPMDGEMVAAVTAALTRTDQAWAGIDYAKGYYEKDSTNILSTAPLPMPISWIASLTSPL
jgi:tetratricopeptide (TPR) repeat protein